MFGILGSIQVCNAAGRPVGLGPLQRTLLAYFLVNAGRGVETDRAIEAIWPGAAPNGSRKRLQVAVARLRKVLDDATGGAAVLETVAGGYVLHASNKSIDATVFEARFKAGGDELARGSPARARERLNEGLALWRGPALADVAFADFAQPEIRRLEELRATALEMRIEADLRLGRHRELIAELEALWAAEPARERLAGQLMLALYRSGRQTRALEVYQGARAQLASELGLEPGPALSQLQAAILGHASELELRPPDGRSPERSHPSVPRRWALPSGLADVQCRPFVGRSEELDAVLRAVDCNDDRPRLVLVTGEAGVGKSSLAAQVASQVQRRFVMYGRCDEEPLEPYQPFSEALRQLLTRQPGLLEFADLAQRGELARILPALGEAPSDGGHDRHRLLDAVAALLEGIEDRLLLVIDDLQWADASALTMLRYLVRRRPGALVVLGTSRDAADAGGPLGELAVDLRRGNAFERVELDGLGADAIETLMAVRTGAVPQPEVIQQIQERTGGNPFFVEQLLRADSDAQVPQDIKELIGQRMTRLGPFASETLQLGSVVGMEFELRVLLSVIDRPDDVIDALESAVAAGLVAEAGGAAGRFAFAHALARDAIYEAMSATRRARMHQRVGEALERERDSGPAMVAELAHHFAEATGLAAPEKVRHHLVEAARHAARALAFESAAGYLHRALELRISDPQARIELCLTLADNHQRSGAREQAQKVLEEAAALSRDRSDAAALARVALAYANGFDWYGFSYDADPKLSAFLEEALAARPDDPNLHARLLARLGLERYCAARYEEAATLSAQAVELADRQVDPATRLLAHYSALLPLDAPEDVARVERQAGEIIAIAWRLEDHEIAFRARVFRLRARLQLADLAGVDADVNACQATADRLRQPLYHWQARVLRAMRALMRGAIEEGEREAQAAVTIGLEAGHADEAGYAAAPQFLTVASLRGNLLDFEGLLMDRLESLPIMEARIEAMLCWVLAEGGSPKKARKWLARCMAREPANQARHSLWLLMVAMLAEASAILAEPLYARRLLPLLHPYAQRCLITGAGAAYAGAVSYYLARLATILRRWDDCERWFSMAVETERRMGAFPALARAELGWTEMLLERDAPGDRALALAMAQRALATSERLGLPALTARARAAASGPRI